jgi:hypothetical protein
VSRVLPSGCGSIRYPPSSRRKLPCSK